MNWQSTTVIFGGAFDPPHLGHLEAVQGLLHNPGVQRVLIVPSGRPNLKTVATAGTIRLSMLRTCFEKELQSGQIFVDDFEIRSASSHPDKTTYSYDTIERLKREYPHLAFAIGADQLALLPQWYRFKDLLSACHWIVLVRKPDGQALAQKGLAELQASGLARPSGRDHEWSLVGNKYLKLVETHAQAISSTQIREIIAKTGQPPTQFLPSTLVSYLKAQGLYGIEKVNHGNQ